MAAAVLNIIVEQGATFRKTLTWKTGDPAVPVNLFGYHARLQFRPTLQDTSTPLISITDVANSQGQIVLGESAGTIELYIKDTATDTLTANGVYDLELIAPNTDVIRLVQGKYTVKLNVTR